MLGYLSLISLAFVLVVWAVMNVTGSFLVDQRVAEELESADALALEVTAYVRTADADALYDLLVERGREYDARILMLNADGTVWVDSLSELNGVRLGHGEVTDVTSLKMDRSYGFHHVESGEWIGYYTSGVTSRNELIGVVMMVSSIADLTKSLMEIQNSIIVFFVAVLVIVLLVGLYFSSVITHPINELNNLMQQTARAGFTVRANPRGNDEIAQLGVSESRDGMGLLLCLPLQYFGAVCIDPIAFLEEKALDLTLCKTHRSAHDDPPVRFDLDGQCLSAASDQFIFHSDLSCKP